MAVVTSLLFPRLNGRTGGGGVSMSVNPVYDYYSTALLKYYIVPSAFIIINTIVKPTKYGIQLECYYTMTIIVTK